MQCSAQLKTDGTFTININGTDINGTDREKLIFLPLEAQRNILKTSEANPAVFVVSAWKGTDWWPGKYIAGTNKKPGPCNKFTIPTDDVIVTISNVTISSQNDFTIARFPDRENDTCPSLGKTINNCKCSWGDHKDCGVPEPNFITCAVEPSDEKDKPCFKACCEKSTAASGCRFGLPPNPDPMTGVF